jgi:hypothetical protein
MHNLPYAQLVKGPGLMKGYMQNPRATAEVMDAEGYFNTGDLGRKDPATGAVSTYIHTYKPSTIDTHTRTHVQCSREASTSVSV